MTLAVAPSKPRRTLTTEEALERYAQGKCSRQVVQWCQWRDRKAANAAAQGNGPA